MTTSMNRLQISLKERQAEYLLARARKEGTSMAEVLRRMIQHEMDAELAAIERDSFLSIAGIVNDPGPLFEDLAVSERPEQYLYSPVDGLKTGE